MIRASGLARLDKCPGSLEAEKDLPEETSPFSAEGTLLHDKARDFWWIYRDEGVDDNTIPKLAEDLTDMQKTKLFWMLTEVDVILAPHGGIRKILMADEAEAVIAKYRKKEIASGHPDLVILARDGSVHVFDYKTGWSDEPQAYVHIQLRDYVVAIWQDMFKGQPNDEVYGHIISWGQESSTVLYKIADLRMARDELWGIVERQGRTPNKRIPGAVQCRWCKACGVRSRCPESCGSVTAIVEYEGQQISPTKLSELLELRVVAKRAIKKMEDVAKAMLADDSTSIPGWQLGRPRTRRTITDNAEAYRLLLADDAIDADTYVQDCCVAKLGAIKQRVMLTKGLSSRKADEYLRETLGDVIDENPEAKPLKPDTGD